MKKLSMPALASMLVFTGAANAATVVATEGFVRDGIRNAKEYADNVAATKQEPIGGEASGRVVTNTGITGEVGSIGVDGTVTQNSDNLVTSGAVYGAVAAMTADSQQVLSGTPGSVATYSSMDGALGETGVDTAPTSSSSNLITSNAVYTGLAAKQNALVGGAENVGKVIVGTEGGYEWGELTPDTYSDTPALTVESGI
ncbi:MAG: hypothetical protein LBL21_01650 [Rickettsiales bacterium]|jgi:hypothetical protein|nr:hypothetical protein [Rickettsiales bacterium]